MDEIIKRWTAPALTITNTGTGNPTNVIKEAKSNMPVENQNDSYAFKAYMMPRFKVVPAFKIKSVRFYNNRVTKVEFEDGCFTKAVCGENDIFDEDVGITVCVLKKLLGGQKEGTKTYVKMLRDAHRVIDAEKKRQEEVERQEAEEKRRREKLERKSKEKKERARIEKINDQIDAILHAHYIIEEREREDDLK